MLTPIVRVVELGEFERGLGDRVVPASSLRRLKPSNRAALAAIDRLFVPQKSNDYAAWLLRILKRGKDEVGFVVFQ